MNSIHPKAKLGKNVSVGPFTFIDEDVIIGDNCEIAANVNILNGARIGHGCKIFPGAVVSAIPQDKKFEGEYSLAEIGNNTTIRECVTINRGTKYSYTTKVGNNVLLMAYVHIAHDCIVGDHCVLANATNLAGHVIIEDYVIFGGMSAAHQFIRVGKHAFIAGGTLLRKDVPPFLIAAKDPAVYSGINSVGLKRNGFNMDEIHEIQDVYRYLYSNGMNTSQALERIMKEMDPSKYRDDIVDFISKSDKGIIKGIHQS